jgi:pimeloyl-ACP methyl ester carboxylesterase
LSDISASTSESAGQFLDWRGHRIFVRRSGRGDPVLLIHGFPTSSRDWQPLVSQLNQEFTWISFDLLGFGRSDKPVDFDYSMAAQADLAEAVLAHFGIEACRVLAHDYGDTVAQELLARQLEGSQAFAMQQLCLLNGGLFPEAHSPRLIQKLLASPLGGLIARLTRYSRFAATMNEICKRPLGEVELRSMWELMEHNNGRAVLPRLIRYMAERRRMRSRWVGALEQSRIPMRLIDGIDDPISGSQLVRRYRELVPNADVVELAGVGHYPQLEAVNEVVAAFREFARQARHSP